MTDQKNLTATSNEICEYIEKEIRPGHKVKLSLGRCYTPGTVITNNQGILQIEVYYESIKGINCIDVHEIKDLIVELEHEHEKGICIIEAENE